MRTPTSSRQEMFYLRERDEGRVSIYELNAAQIFVCSPALDVERVEILTTNIRPSWIVKAKRMTAHEARRRIIKSRSISPQFKAVYLAMLDINAGADATAKEVCHA